MKQQIQQNNKNMKRFTLMAVVTAMTMWLQAADFNDGLLDYNIKGDNTVEVAGFNSFGDGQNVITLNIPATVTNNGDTYTVTSIKYMAFPYNSNLTILTIPNSILNIGRSAFEGCTGLTSIIIPNSVTTIESSAFKNCTGLISVTIGTGVTDMKTEVFGGCTNITSVVWNAKNCVSLSDFYDLTGKDSPFYDARGHITSFTLGEEVESIPNRLCYGMNKLSSIYIPSSVTNIGEYSFDGCTGLTSITIPNSVTSINTYAFHGCTGFTSITIPNSITSMHYSAFRDCANITSVVWNAKNCEIRGSLATTNSPFEDIPIISFFFGNEVESIPSHCCSGLNKLSSITIPSNVTSIGEYAFYDCTGLSSLTIANGVKSIGNYAFYSCNLTSVTIPNSVTSIGDNAFQFCSGLTSVMIGDGITQIGNFAFPLNDGSNYICMATLPPSTSNMSFYITSINSQLWVPCNSVDAYKSKWGGFKFNSISCLAFTENDGEVTTKEEAQEATIIWTFHIKAASYTLTVKKQSTGETITMTFDGFGGAMDINYSNAALSEDGLQYVLSDLEPSTKYSYTLTVTNQDESIIKTYTGNFTTKSLSDDIKNVQDNGGASAPRKVIRDGQVYIERGGKTYSVIGSEIK